MSPECQDLIIKLLNPDPSKRLGSKGAKEIKNHQWFRGKYN
jgi:serine/threonine-protein kinase RIM15